MAKGKAAPKSISMLDSVCTEDPITAVPYPDPCPAPKRRLPHPDPSPPRSRKRRLATPQQKGPPSRSLSDDHSDLWDYIWSEVETPTPYREPELSPGPCHQPCVSPTPGGGIRSHTRSSPSSCPQSFSPQPEETPSKTAIVPYVRRRRLVGKQPAQLTLAIEVYCRRRVRGKQAAPAVPERKTISVRGHYDVLGIQRTASAAEIHAAYRRRALETHPDKGGDPRDFHRVKTAFEELANESKRAAYDRSCVLFGRKDGMEGQSTSTQVVTQSRPAAELYFGAARVAHFSLLASDIATWSASLGLMQDEVLQTLRDIMKGAKTKVASSVDAACGANLKGNLQGWQGPTCITHMKSGYKVTVSWDDISVSTGFTKSLTQVIDWQIALLSMKEAAQLRMKCRGAGFRDPLIESELLQVLASEPDLELTFTVTVNTPGKKGKKISTPGVMNLDACMDFRRRLAAILRGKTSEAALQGEKRKIEQDAAKECKRQKLSESKLLVAVHEELQARSTGRSRGTTNRSSRAIVVHQPSKAQTGSSQETIKTPSPKEKSDPKVSPLKHRTARKRTAQCEAPRRKLRV